MLRKVLDFLVGKVSFKKTYDICFLSILIGLALSMIKCPVAIIFLAVPFLTVFFRYIMDFSLSNDEKMGIVADKLRKKGYRVYLNNKELEYKSERIICTNSRLFVDEERKEAFIIERREWPDS